MLSVLFDLDLILNQLAVLKFFPFFKRIFPFLIYSQFSKDQKALEYMKQKVLPPPAFPSISVELTAINFQLSVCWHYLSNFCMFN